MVSSSRSSISVAIPTFNGARHLAEAIRSVLGQTEPMAELRILDDRSEDDSAEIARTEAGDRGRIEVNSERLGLAGNWNRCVCEASSALVSVFHQDDVMHPGHLAAHARAFAERPDLGFSCGGFQVIDAEGHEIPESVVEGASLGPSARFFETGDFVQELAARNPVRCSTVVMNRAAHEEVGGFNPEYRYAVDWEFWVRMARARPVAWVPEATVSVRWHAESETHRFRRGTADLDEVGRLLEQVAAMDSGRWPDGDRIRQEGRTRLARAYLNRAYEALKGGRNRLARTCLGRSWSLCRRLTLRELADPRFGGRWAVSMLGFRWPERG